MTASSLFFSSSAGFGQDPVWSPTPFRPAANVVDETPSNPLRNSSSSNQLRPINHSAATSGNSSLPSSNVESSVTQRWRKAEQAIQKLDQNRSYSMALRDSSDTSDRPVIQQPSRKAESGSPKFTLRPAQPSSGFDKNSKDLESGVRLVSHEQVAESQATTSNEWRDVNSRGPQTDSRFVNGSNDGKVRLKPTPARSVQFDPSPQDNGDRNTPLPEIQLPQGEQLPNENVPLTQQAPEKESIKPKINNQRGGRSLIPEDSKPKNPFPIPNESMKSPSDLEVPSRDPLRSLDNFKMDDDRPPVPPNRESAMQNCDEVREFAIGADIQKIRVDSSPNFVEGFKSKDRPQANTKEKFLENSPERVWYSVSGESVAKGKLVDLVYGTVVIESASGARVSYLLQRLSDADQVFVAESWGIPVTCPMGDQPFPDRNFVDTTVTWKATGACHKPLYFEEVQLERYGHEWGPAVQPAISTVKFFGNVALLPYKMGIHPMNECQYSLGYYRPGSCAPWTVGPVPISLRGALMQAKVVTGTAWALP